MALQTRLTEKFDLKHAIISAPMALVGGGALAAAVSKVGGIGLIGGGYGDKDWLEEQFRAAGNAAVGCGFITWSLTTQPELLTRTLERKPSALFLSFGDPTPYAAEIHAADVPLICQVQTMAGARLALEAGSEIIVAQGAEAGGHGAARGTFPLVPEVADLIAREASETLLCAAGGIADGRGLAAALVLGADGVVMGSAFTASHEVLVAPGWQDALLSADGDKPVQTGIVDIARKRDWPKEYFIRVLKNKLIDEWQGREAELLTDQEAAADRYTTAAAAGDTENYGVIVGENVGLINSIEPASAIVERVTSEAEVLLSSLQYC